MKSASGDITGEIVRCTEDMSDVVCSGKLRLDAQSRAYDLMDYLLEDSVREYVFADDGISAAVKGFVGQYEASSHLLSELYDGKSLENELDARLAPLRRRLEDMRFEVASAVSLHEFAKETFEKWQKSGIFMRRRLLTVLRERAGFPLESHRIGNYVARTFDLMNEAQLRFAKAQQAVFSADVGYKIRPGIYDDLYRILTGSNL